MAVDVSEPCVCWVTPIAQSTHMRLAPAMWCATISSVSMDRPHICDAASMVNGSRLLRYASTLDPPIDERGVGQAMIEQIACDGVQPEQIGSRRRMEK